MRMRINKVKVCCVVTAFTLIASSFMGYGTMTANAKEMSVGLTGNLYEFDKNSKYEVDGSDACGDIAGGTSYGRLFISGNMKEIADVNGVDAYEVQDSNVSVKYDLSDVFANATKSTWHLIDDKTKKVNGVGLEENLLSGAIILQTSLTGESWITDVVYTDIRDKESGYTECFYISNDIQQVNGCYYRIIVAYEVSKENEVNKGLTNWSGKETEYKKCAEVYEFYLINSSENSSNATSPDAKPRKELGSKINTGKDNGYSGNVAITKEDPHYGWNLGTFFVNGYTRETSLTDGTPLFLKNVGDRVTLWFNLHEDIKCLNGKSNLSIYADENGYDQYFEIEKTYFKRGALIISYTDFEGKTHEPVIYTDYLAASARTGANTKVELFEEGDYEVALNYEILDDKGVDEYTNYRIYFKFSIRNGNCMVYPFDVVTGAELSDKALTENGFKLDIAKSRYLTIDVKKEILKKSESGYITDERFNRPAKDGESYSDAGIYTFTVKNLYTGSEPTTKTIYVGDTPEIRALASGYSLAEINSLLAQGAQIKNDGTIELPKVEEHTPSEEVTTEGVKQETEPVSTPTVVESETSKEVTSDKVVIEEPEVKEEKSNGVGIIIAVVSVAIILIGYLVIQRKKSKRIVIDMDEVSEEADE